MTPSEWQQWSVWRAFEELDPNGNRVPHATRTEASLHAREELRAADLPSSGCDARAAAFLTRRSERLAQAMKDREDGHLARQVHLPRWPRWLPFVLLVGAAVVGWLTTHLGQERELNLLALPLLGVLAWNALVVMLSLLGLLLRRGGAAREGDSPKATPTWLERWLGAPKVVPGEWEAAVRRKFQKHTDAIQWASLLQQLRQWLHIAAAVLGLVSAGALFARGWAREYRVVWESTLLDAPAAEQFFSTLFRPASMVFGVPIPLQDVAGMRRSEGVASQSAPALPWLQLYAGTLALGVVIPRALLLGVGFIQKRRIWREQVQAQDWNRYAIQKLRAVEGDDTERLVVSYGNPVPPEVRERWLGWLGERHGGLTSFDLRFVAEGEEEAWLSDWEPTAPEVELIFFLASTPEEEVQGEWVRRLGRTLSEHHLEPRLNVLLDASELAGRWTAMKREERVQLWLHTLGAAVQKVRVADENGQTEAIG